MHIHSLNLYKWSVFPSKNTHFKCLLKNLRRNICLNCQNIPFHQIYSDCKVRGRRYDEVMAPCSKQHWKYVRRQSEVVHIKRISFPELENKSSTWRTLPCNKVTLLEVFRYQTFVTFHSGKTVFADNSNTLHFLSAGIWQNLICYLHARAYLPLAPPPPETCCTLSAKPTKSLPLPLSLSSLTRTQTAPLWTDKNGWLIVIMELKMVSPFAAISQTSTRSACLLFFLYIFIFAWETFFWRGEGLGGEQAKQASWKTWIDELCIDEHLDTGGPFYKEFEGIP